jgi:hypothetical protein
LGRIDITYPKIGTQGEKRTRRGRGKRKGKDTRVIQDGTENGPPPANNRIRYLAAAVRAGWDMLISVLDRLAYDFIRCVFTTAFHVAGSDLFPVTPSMESQLRPPDSCNKVIDILRSDRTPTVHRIK